MIKSKLPYKESRSDPEWITIDVVKPEGLIDWIRLSLGPGRWNYHTIFGEIRIFPPEKKCE